MYSKLRLIKRKILSFIKRTPIVKRHDALQEEIQFWRDWFLTGGLEWPEDYHRRFNPSQPIQEHIARCVDQLKTGCVEILDVGSGPLTKIGYKHHSKQVIITAADLLADEYNRLYRELKIEPPIRTIFADAERLTERFGQNSYDIVHGENCIDHLVHPLQAIEQMIAVSKPEGFVVLTHRENEGKNQRYRELHQWDFTMRNGDFIISDKHGRIKNVSKKLAAFCEVECSRENGDILTVIRKNVN